MLVWMPGMKCVRCTYVSEEGRCGCPCDMCTFPAIPADSPAIEKWPSREGPSQGDPQTRGRMVQDFRALNRQAERSRIPMPDISELMRLMSDGRGIPGSDPEKVTVFKTMWPPMPRSLF